MRLYLSSYKLGDYAERFAELVRGDRRGWVIANALDGLDDERREASTAREIASLAILGLEARDLDLRLLTPETIDAVFGDPDFLWVRGGNVFTLRMAMAWCGLDRIIVDGLAADRFVYAGYSAGPCVLAPSLGGLELCDPVDDCLAAYGDVRYDGLGILDRPFVPHLDSPDHPATELLGMVAAQYAAEGQTFWAVRDGEALVVDGGQPTLAR
jgi:dipeptidase E